MQTRAKQVAGVWSRERTTTSAFSSSPNVLDAESQSSPLSNMTKRNDESVEANDNIPEKIRLWQADPFLAKIVDLAEFQERYGDCLVPKRFPENQPLSNFVDKQRRLYRAYLRNETSSLTPERIEMLNKIGFVWDARTVHPSSRGYYRHRKERDKWNERYAELKETIDQQLERMRIENGQYMDNELELPINRESAVIRAFGAIPSSSTLGVWLSGQRKQYLKWTRTLPSDWNDERNRLLMELDEQWWMNQQQRQWETRFCQLVAYQNHFGDTLVEISFQCKGLANWVSLQRKNYNLKMAGKRSNLTKERQSRLEEIGFVWDRWEEEFLWNNG